MYFRLLVVFFLVLPFVSKAQNFNTVGKLTPVGNLPVASSTRTGQSSLAVCVANNSACSEVPYIFIGNGYWNVESNWLGRVVPPGILPAGKRITINPVVGGECILNVEQTIAAGAAMLILNERRIKVTGKLSYQQ